MKSKKVGIKVNNEDLYGENRQTDDQVSTGQSVVSVQPQVDSKLYQLHKEYEYAMSSKKGAVYIMGHITEDTLYEIIGAVNLIREQRDETTLKNDITIIIMSYGGDVYPMLGIIDFIRGLDVKVNLIVRGAAMSAAALIVAAGTGKRYMSKNSILMLHEFSVELANNTSYNFARNAKHIEYLQDTVYTMLSEFTGKDKEFWQSKLQGDLYLNAEQALEFGLIDQIL